MTTKTDEGTSGCTFQWKIENINHCWVKRYGYIDSPRFIADALGGTEWCLRFYPSGGSNQDYAAFNLHREKDSGPSKLEVIFQVAILDKDGSVLKEKTSTKCSFEKDEWLEIRYYEERKKIFVTQREAFLPENTLTVQCTIWNTEVKPVKPQQLYAETVFKVKRKNFIWRIDNFSTLQSGLKNKIKDGLIEFNLVFIDGLDFKKKLNLNIDSFDESIKYFSFKASTVNSQGEKENYGNYEYFVGDSKRGVLGTLLFPKQLSENKSRYLPNDVLSLNCEYVYSTGDISYEHCGYGVISPDKTYKVESRNEHDIGKGKSLVIPVILNDLKSMYNDQILSDMELRTSTQNFPAHKNILSARSPVFRKMFSSDMKENNNGYVYIDDLEDDTVQRMLLYIYTDTLDGMQFDHACKLYVAADKYEILALKSSCSSFLKENLSPSKACDILDLADRHQDDDLISAVQDFILKHDKEVFGSQQWKNFMKTNVHLAADVMYRFTQCKIHEP